MLLNLFYAILVIFYTLLNNTDLNLSYFDLSYVFQDTFIAQNYALLQWLDRQYICSLKYDLADAFGDSFRKKTFQQRASFSLGCCCGSRAITKAQRKRHSLLKSLYETVYFKSPTVQGSITQSFNFLVHYQPAMNPLHSKKFLSDCWLEDS